MRGVPMRTVQQPAGHADLRTAQRGSHLAEQVLVEAVRTLPALPGAPANGNGHKASDRAETAPGLVYARVVLLQTA